MPRHPACTGYSYATAIAASGHPRPARVLAAAYGLHKLGALPPRATGVTAAMVRARNVAMPAPRGVRYGAR